jgi:hypothetical protein
VAPCLACGEVGESRLTTGFLNRREEFILTGFYCVDDKERSSYAEVSTDLDSLQDVALLCDFVIDSIGPRSRAKTERGGGKGGEADIERRGNRAMSASASLRSRPIDRDSCYPRPAPDSYCPRSQMNPDD